MQKVINLTDESLSPREIDDEVWCPYCEHDAVIRLNSLGQPLGLATGGEIIRYKCAKCNRSFLAKIHIQTFISSAEKKKTITVEPMPLGSPVHEYVERISRAIVSSRARDIGATNLKSFVETHKEKEEEKPKVKAEKVELR